MPTPEQITFFEQNKAEIGILIESANVKRAASGNDPLSEEEIDVGISEMILLKSASKDISRYKFPSPPPVRKAPSLQSVQGEKLSFEIIKCANGFLMNMQGSESGTFIFKTQEELGGIFKIVLFKEVKNGRDEREDNRGESGKPRKPSRLAVVESGDSPT